MKVVVTGASGFVGGNLARHLAAEGAEVVALVRPAGRDGHLDVPGVTIATGNVSDRNSLRGAFSGADAVIHVAALFNRPEASWDDYRRVNVEGTRNVLEAALDRGVGRVVHCSTIGVVTEHGSLPYSEDSPYAPAVWDKYEKTKCEGEQAALALHHSRGVPVVVLRPAQVYGPGDRGKAKFYRMVRSGVIVHPGNTMKHLVYVDDLCRAFALALRKPGIEGEIFIIGGSEPIALRELIDIAADALGVRTPAIRLPAGPMTALFSLVETGFGAVGLKPPVFRRSMDFFTRSVACDVRKALEVLGFRGEVDVRAGVAKTVAWYRDNGLL